MNKIALYLRHVLILTLGLLTGTTFAQDLKLNFFRANDQRGVNVFETSKEDLVPFDGVKVVLGGHFTQQFQSLSHENTAAPRWVGEGENARDLNQLVDLNPGFNLATANLNIDVQLADGIRLHLVTYLSSRHHTEAWVKGGYIQFDKLPLNVDFLDEVMKYVTVKVGHMEINYGDAHFRRTDNGNAIYNPFVGNLVMDGFNTEIGGEVYYQNKGFIGMVGLTNGELNASVTNGQNNPAIYGKLGFDKQLKDNLRVRLTTSVYHTSDLNHTNHLYSGDRTGSRYYLALQPAYVRDWRTGNIRSANATADFRTGRFNPGFTAHITSWMVNPFVKVGGLEVFGTFETTIGGNARTVNAIKDANNGDIVSEELGRWNQVAIEGIYRFFPKENLFVGYRYNTVSDARAETDAQSINRHQIGAGWFITRNVLLKTEYVSQTYNNFASDDYRNGGKFNGVMVEAVVGF